MAKPSPKSLVLDLLSTLRRGSMPVKALVAAADIFGIAENALRVSLARLHAAQLVERDTRGLYRLGPAAKAVDAQVTNWRRTPERFRSWDGSWIAVQRPANRAGRKQGDRRGEHAMLLVGFRKLEPGLHIRPNNLVGGVERSRNELQQLGLAEQAAVFGLNELDASREARACSLWDTEALVEDYRATCADLVRSQAALPLLPTGEAMVESFVIGGRAIRQIVLDPLLPDALIDASEFAQLIETTRTYDLAGRACWAGFLGEHGVINGNTPADLRVGDATAALPATGV